MTQADKKLTELIKHGSRPRNRTYTLDFKLSVIRQTLEPGASVAKVARDNDLNANMVFKWRQLYREGSLGPSPSSPADNFVPVRICEEQKPDESMPVEIVLPNGVSVRADAGIGGKYLQRVLQAAGKVP